MDMDQMPGMNEGGVSPEAFPVLAGDVFNPELFHYLQKLYQARTGYQLVFSDTNGSILMGLPNCEKFPCMNSCRECREQIIAESLRTGKVCLDACHEGYVIWGLPVAHGDLIIGGLVVVGGDRKSSGRIPTFEAACDELRGIMKEHGLLPESQTPAREGSAHFHRYVCRDSFTALNLQIEAHLRPLIDALQLAEFDLARKHFARIRSAFINADELPRDLVRGLFSKLVYQTHSQFTEAGVDAYACLSEAGFLSDLISKAKTKRQLEIALNSYFQRFFLLSQQRTKDADDLLVEKATTYLEEHLREELDRESVAKAIGISPSHFSRLIREKKGRTFIDLLNQYRVEHAAKMLVRSSRTLADISSETGFCDQSYFSKVFKRYKGESPAQYRKSHRIH